MTTALVMYASIGLLWASFNAWLLTVGRDQTRLGLRMIHDLDIDDNPKHYEPIGLVAHALLWPIAMPISFTFNTWFPHVRRFILERAAKKLEEATRKQKEENDRRMAELDAMAVNIAEAERRLARHETQEQAEARHMAISTEIARRSTWRKLSDVPSDDVICGVAFLYDGPRDNACLVLKTGPSAKDGDTSGCGGQTKSGIYIVASIPLEHMPVSDPKEGTTPTLEEGIWFCPLLRPEGWSVWVDIHSHRLPGEAKHDFSKARLLVASAPPAGPSDPLPALMGMKTW